jgi:nicotinate-nucleotide--dimethylbenzimidazole phosphoribosyltransferase
MITTTNLPTPLMQTIDRIQPRSESWYAQALQHLDQLTKPPGSLGRLEEIAARLVAIQQVARPSCERKAVYVFAGDHGVVEEGVSAYPQEVTGQMVLNFAHGGAAVNVLARSAGADVVVVDVGVAAEIGPAPGVLVKRVRRGTRNFLKEPAMTREETFAAMEVGISLAQAASREGRKILAIGEMGIGNTTSASALTAAITKADPGKVTGAGTGVTGGAWEKKVEVVRKALAVHARDLANPLDTLACLGGYEIAAMSGMVLGAAAQRMAVIIDGFISTAAAAVASQFAPASRDYMIAGHTSQEPGHRFLLDYLGLEPLLSLNMRLGEGSGAVLAFTVVEAAVRIYNEMATFASAGVSQKSNE